jgi:hypothetical protein
MKKITGLLICILMLQHFSANAQSFAINTDGSVADASALLDIKSINKGLLMPRMTLAQKNTISLPATGLLIYQTDGTMGLYVNNGTPAVPNWQLVLASANAWTVTGNGGTDTAVNFIGTTDNMALRFKVNNQQAGLLSNDNSLFGLGAGKNMGTATGITAIGSNALGKNFNRNNLVAVGDSALYKNSTGVTLSYQAVANSAFGYRSLLNNTVGYHNTATGYESMYNNTSGTSNTANGSGALYSNTVGYQNTAIGSYALYYNIGSLLGLGENNTAIGFMSTHYNNTGALNTGVGSYSNMYNYSGDGNTAIGYQSLLYNDADFNTSVGFYSLASNITGTRNSAFGDSADVLSSNLVNATAIGSNAAVNCSNCLVLGSTNGINHATSNVNVGIGTTKPNALLHVQKGAVLFDSTIGGTPVSGAGTRMMWIPAKAAFRAGYVNGTNWDDVNIGNSSFATGYNTKASGVSSIAMGRYDTASGDHSIALGFANTASGVVSLAMGIGSIASGYSSTSIGQNTTASGDYCTAMGQYTIASGYNSSAMGWNSIASGNVSTAMGVFTKSKSYGGFVTGPYNDSTNAASQTLPNSLNRLFQIGNGTADNARSNAMTVLQNGNIGIGELNPTSPLNFTSTLGDKIALWGNGSNHYGLGIQPSLLQLYTMDAGNDIAFGYGSSAAMTENVRFKGNGNVGIGTNNPIAKLNITGSEITPNGLGVGLQLTNTASTNSWTLRAGATGTNTPAGGFSIGDNAAYRLVITNTGNVGIGTTAPTLQLELSTNSAGKPLSSAWNITSDERLKTIDGNYTKGLKDILKLNTIMYHYKKGNLRNLPTDEQGYGFSAQEVQKIFPEAVKTGKDGYLSLDIHPILVSYINAFKEQQQLMDELKKQNEILIKRIENIEKELTQKVNR